MNSKRYLWVGVICGLAIMAVCFAIFKGIDRGPPRSPTPEPDLHSSVPEGLRKARTAPPAASLLDKTGNPGSAITVTDPETGELLQIAIGPGPELESIENGAARFSDLSPADQSKAGAITEFTRRFYRERPEEAIEWILGLKESGGVFENAFRVLGEEMAANGEFGRAVKLIEELPPSPGVNALFDGLLVAAAKEDPEMAIEMRTLNPDLGRLANQKYLLGLGVLNGHPREAISAVHRFLPKEQRPGELRHIYSQWAAVDPEAAAADAMARPPSRGRNSSVYGLVETWGNRDFEAAKAWVHRLDPSPEKDQALSALVENLRSSLSEDAFNLALQIRNEGMRANRLRNVVADWITFNQDEAIRAINRADLPAEVKEELLVTGRSRSGENG